MVTKIAANFRLYLISEYELVNFTSFVVIKVLTLKVFCSLNYWLRP